MIAAYEGSYLADTSASGNIIKVCLCLVHMSFFSGGSKYSDLVFDMLLACHIYGSRDLKTTSNLRHHSSNDETIP